MSDYQGVRVTRVRGRVLDLEVTEYQLDTLDGLLSGGRLKKGAEKKLVKLAAELLLELEYGSNALVEAGQRIGAHRDELEKPGHPEPDEFVANVQLISAEPLVQREGEPWRQHRARLRVDLTRDEYADAFAVGMAWGAVASDLDFSDFWEHLE